MDERNVSAEKWNEIYSQGGWFGGGSGLGSRLENNFDLINILFELILKYEIKSIVDIGCGDLQWMPNLLKRCQIDNYTGVDCVDKLIKDHENLYPEYTFLLKDLLSDDFEIEGEYDLLICKDILQHNYDMSWKFFDQINKIKANIKIIIEPEWIDVPLFYNFLELRKYKSDEIKTIFINS